MAIFIRLAYEPALRDLHFTSISPKTHSSSQANKKHPTIFFAYLFRKFKRWLINFPSSE